MPEKKILFIICDGMADLPLQQLSGKTPLEYSKTPNMDKMACNGFIGMTQTIPEGMHPGSDVANLSLFGYDPKACYSGRAPLEALNLGIDLGDSDIAVRCNMVSIQKEIMEDFTAGHITNDFAKIVIDDLNNKFQNTNYSFYPGVSYRNILVWKNYPHGDLPITTPPHDIQGQLVEKHLPSGNGSEELNHIMKVSQEMLKSSKYSEKKNNNHGLGPSSVWLWGSGKKPNVESFKEKYSLTGYTISAVDLIHGIGRAAGLKKKHVEGATGYIDTNYEGKAKAALECLKESDFVFLHIESPDESGHEGSIEKKIKSIEDIDNRVLPVILDGIKEFKEYIILMIPDHPTPICKKTHTSDPVPFCVYTNDSDFSKKLMRKKANVFSEKEATSTGLFFPEAHNFVQTILKK